MPIKERHRCTFQRGRDADNESRRRGRREEMRMWVGWRNRVSVTTNSKYANKLNRVRREILYAIHQATLYYTHSTFYHHPPHLKINEGKLYEVKLYEK
jgi:hypothetical protein